MTLDPAEIRKMAERYTQAWCNRSGEEVASFFTEDATSIINAIYLWTLEGTNSGPGGTGNFVRIGGWQNLRLNEDLLIEAADGGYDAEDYDRQIAGGD